LQQLESNSHADEEYERLKAEEIAAAGVKTPI